MTFKRIEKGYALWQDSILIPTVKKDGTKAWWRKEIKFEDADKYWEYICEDNVWNIYYVRRGKDRRLAQINVGIYSPESIIARIHDRDISVADCRKIEEEHGRPIERTPIVSLIWSKEFDGRSVFELMEQWQKMPYAHVKMVIENEGGSIDNNGIIHKGK